MIKIDLHTHSIGSKDGGLHLKDYRQAFSEGLLDVIAITDHNAIDFAQHAQQALGPSIIVGEEVDTGEGEVIGLYLKTLVEKGLGMEETIHRIRQQDGLVYIPHPFETKRKGVQEALLNQIVEDVDIIEGYNGRAWGQNFSNKALLFADHHPITVAASSDAHGKRGWGRTYTLINASPQKTTLLMLLKDATYSSQRPTLISLLYPSYHRLRKGKVN